MNDNRKNPVQRQGTGTRAVGKWLCVAVCAALMASYGCSSAEKKEGKSSAEAKAGSSSDNTEGAKNPSARDRSAPAGESEKTAASGTAPSPKGRSAGSEPVDPSATIALAAPVSAQVAAESGARIVKEPSSDSEGIGEVKSGTAVSVKGYRRGIYIIGGQAGRWVEVEAAGKSGWLFGGFLSGPTVATGGALPEEQPKKE